MKKYYIGFMVLMAITLGAFIYAITQAGAAKADKATDKVVEQVSNKMEEYVANHGSVPQSLGDIGIKDVPKSVTYQALGTSKYKICFFYNTATSGFDAGWASLLTGGITGGTEQPTYSYGGGYFDSSVEFSHKKGNNCQTVESTYSSYQSPIDTRIYSSGNISTASDCAQKSYQVMGSATVASINTAASQITFSPDNQYVYDQTGTQVKLTTKTYNSDTLFCDQTLKKADVSAVKVGQTVEVGLASASSDTLSEVDAY